VTHDQEEALSMSDRIAVMHDGRVMQCGVPEDVYERPEEPFVAGFIGISNLIEGTVGDPGMVELASGVSVPAPLPAECGRGERVRIAVRPEKIAVDHLEPGMVQVEGTVEQRVYLGMTTQITVALGNDARLVALEQTPTGPEPTIAGRKAIVCGWAGTPSTAWSCDDPPSPASRSAAPRGGCTRRVPSGRSYRKPRRSGASLSRPVSRILSCAVIYLSGA